MNTVEFKVTVRCFRAYNVQHVADEVKAFTDALVEFQTHTKPLVTVDASGPQDVQPTKPHDER